MKNSNIIEFCKTISTETLEELPKKLVVYYLLENAMKKFKNVLIVEKQENVLFVNMESLDLANIRIGVFLFIVMTQPVLIFKNGD